MTGTISPTLSPGLNGASGAGSPSLRVLADYRFGFLPRASDILSCSSLCKQIKATRNDDPQLDPQLGLHFPWSWRPSVPQGAPGSCYLAWGGAFNNV